MTTWALFDQLWDFVQADAWSERLVLAPLDGLQPGGAGARGAQSTVRGR